MQAAMTMQRIHPKSQQEPMDIRIPYGTAFVALAASSDICTQLSKAPIVHIGESQLIMKLHPVGQVVKFSTCVKMYEALFRDFCPTGRAMIVAKISMKFMTTKTVCSFPMTLAIVDAIKAWQATVARNTA